MAKIFLDISMGLMFVAYIFVYRWYVRPALQGADPRRVLGGMVLLHAGRAMGFIALFPGIPLPGLPPEYAYPVAYCDVMTSVFALIGAFMLQRRWVIAIPWIWFMNVFGLSDILYSGSQLILHDGFAYIGSMYYVYVWFVPTLVITHVLIFRRLLRWNSGQGNTQMATA